MRVWCPFRVKRNLVAEWCGWSTRTGVAIVVVVVVFVVGVVVVAAVGYHAGGLVRIVVLVVTIAFLAVLDVE